MGCRGYKQKRQSFTVKAFGRKQIACIGKMQDSDGIMPIPENREITGNFFRGEIPQRVCKSGNQNNTKNKGLHLGTMTFPESVRKVIDFVDRH